MGNRPAGQQLGGDGASGQMQNQLLEVHVRSSLGLALQLASEDWGGREGLMAEVPKSITSTATIKLFGHCLAGRAVYTCGVTVGQAAVQTAVSTSNKSLKTCMTDYRAARTEQYLALVVVPSSGWVGGEKLCFGAAYGSFEGGAAAALRQAEQAASAEEEGEAGLCVWQRADAPSRGEAAHRFCLQVRKPEASRRSQLLESLEQGGGAALTGERVPADPGERPPLVAAAPQRRISKVEDVAPAPVAAARGPGAPPAECAPPQAASPASRAETTRRPRVLCPARAAPTASVPAPVPLRDILAAAAVGRSPALAGGEDAARPADDVPTTDGAAPPADDSFEAEGATAAAAPGSEGAARSAGDTLVGDCTAPPGDSRSAREGAATAVEPEPAAATTVGATVGDTEPRRPASRTGALALEAVRAAEEAAKRRVAEAEQQRLAAEEAEKTRREAEEAERQARLQDVLLREAQDQEFQQSLLMDEVKDLLAREGQLRTEAEKLEAQVEAADKAQRHAVQRLERFGENPRLAEEAARAEEQKAAAQARREEVTEELASVSAQIADKNEIISTMLAAS